MIGHLDLPTVCTRARGLGQHLFRRAELEQLAGFADVSSLSHALAQTDRLVEGVPRPATPAAIEAAVRRAAARHLARLATWAGPAPALDLFYAEQDRRTLRSMLRGALEGAPAEARLAGLLPTERLPEGALLELARQPTPAKVVLHLVVLRHPDAERLLPLATRAQPVLLDLELALARGFAERMSLAARAGDRNLREVIRDRIELSNMEMALALASGSTDVDPAACFVPGGAALTKASYVEVCRAGSRAEAAKRLVRALGHTALAAVARAAGSDPARVEREALVRALVEQRQKARLDPLGSAPLVRFLLRLEAQSRDMLRLAWGASLGAPASVVRQDLVTPWN